MTEATYNHFAAHLAEATAEVEAPHSRHQGGRQGAERHRLRRVIERLGVERRGRVGWLLRGRALAGGVGGLTGGSGGCSTAAGRGARRRRSAGASADGGKRYTRSLH